MEKLSADSKLSLSLIHIFNKQNEGLVQARKSGIDIATGKYIQYLDSDDIMQDVYKRQPY